MKNKEEKFDKYPTVSDLSKAERSCALDKEIIKYPELSGFCSICGKRIGQMVFCRYCGFDRSTDYEDWCSLGKIPEGIITVQKKRELYQQEQFVSIVKEMLKPMEKALKQTEKKNKELQSSYEELKKKYISLNDNLEQLKKQIETQDHELNQKTIQNKTTANTSNKRQRKNLQVGDEIDFGSYPQTKEGIAQPISWNVLKVKDGKALLQSVRGLAAEPFHREITDVTWENCDLRKWLNSDFYMKAFATHEQEQILAGIVKAEKNPKTFTDPGNDVTDHIFLLSVDEVQKYYKNDEERKCKPTAYAEANGVSAHSERKYCCWWLRSLGFIGSAAVNVDSDGSIQFYGCVSSSGSVAVRPALWISL